MSEEKGWWEGGEDSPEEEVEDSPEEQVEVGAGGGLSYFLAALFFLGGLLVWSYLENRMSTSDSIFVQVCCAPLFGFLWYVFF